MILKSMQKVRLTLQQLIDEYKQFRTMTEKGKLENLKRLYTESSEK
jgi:hypothetical protein